jgi:small-conductance mechanosensitive channel
MVNLTQIFEQLLHTNASTSEILSSIVLFAVVALVGWVIYSVFNRYFCKWAEKTKTTLDDDIIEAVKSIILILIIVIGIEYALTPLSFLQPYYGTMETVVEVIEVFLGAFGAVSILNIFADYYGNRSASSGKNKRHIVFMLKKIIQIGVFVSAIIIILIVRNFDLTGAVVGLGIGGIAIAFALQSTLSDFFNAFFIYFDRPFEIGDFIVVGSDSGTVVNITIRSTRIKLLSGEELIVPNKELTSASVRNFRKLEKRRVTFTIGVTYETPTEKLEKVPLILRGIIESEKQAEIERVHFIEFADFALKFLVSFYVKVADYGIYLDTQQSINFAIKRAFEREGIEMAYPTSTVYLKKTGPN